MPPNKFVTFFVVVVMNISIDIFKLFLPWNIIKIHFEMHNFLNFFPNVHPPINHDFRRSMHKIHFKMHRIAPYYFMPPYHLPSPNRHAAFLIIVAMNIEIFKLFLPKYIIKNTLKCTKLHRFFSSGACPFRGSMPPYPPK